MSDANLTKLALAQSLKDLMVRKNFARISVSDISEHCGLTRQTFYYHFKDKYDLMNWIYVTETAPFMYNNKDMGQWKEGLQALCNYMRLNKIFYLNALNTTGQNSFQEYLHDYTRDITRTVIGNIGNTDLDEESLAFIADVIAVIFVSLTQRWAHNGMKEDPSEYIIKLTGLFDGRLLRALEKQEIRINKENNAEIE